MELLSKFLILTLSIVISYCKRAPGPARIGLDGGYEDVVIKLNKDVCNEDCSDRMRKLKVMFGFCLLIKFLPMSCPCRSF